MNSSENADDTLSVVRSASGCGAGVSGIAAGDVAADGPVSDRSVTPFSSQPGAVAVGRRRRRGRASMPVVSPVPAVVVVAGGGRRRPRGRRRSRAACSALDVRHRSRIVRAIVVAAARPRPPPWLRWRGRRPASDSSWSPRFPLWLLLAASTDRRRSRRPPGQQAADEPVTIHVKITPIRRGDDQRRTCGGSNRPARA